MNIRSITCFVNIDRAETAGRAIRQAGELAGTARQALEAAGIPVQTTRLATQPMSHLPGDPLALAEQYYDLGFSLFTFGLNGPDYDMTPVKAWLEWRDAKNA